MGLFDKIKGFIGDPEDEDDFEEEQEENMDFVSKATETPEQFAADNAKRSNKVVNIHATAQLQVVLVKPERFEDASAVADHLNAKRTVVLNLESANKDVGIMGDLLDELENNGLYF